MKHRFEGHLYPVWISAVRNLHIGYCAYAGVGTSHWFEIAVLAFVYYIAEEEDDDFPKSDAPCI